MIVAGTDAGTLAGTVAGTEAGTDAGPLGAVGAEVAGMTDAAGAVVGAGAGADVVWAFTALKSVGRTVGGGATTLGG